MTTEQEKHRKKAISQALLKRFEQDYEFILATKDEDRKKVYALRHEVFLRELHYDMREDKSHHLEQDEYDNSSIHCLIKHRASGLSAGCMRLVIPTPDEDSPLKRLPVEIHGRKHFDHPDIHPRDLPSLQLCEVSRLAIARPFRATHNKERPLPYDGDGYRFSLAEAKTFPLISIGLFLCTYSLVGLTGRRHVFAMMEPRLPRLLALSGFHFTKVSQTIEYHGTRNAYYIDHRKAEQEMHQDLMPLYLHIQKALAPQLDAALPPLAATLLS
ncbi:PEP-CTERM/exosortase system-associated acyltransferase [Halomonas cerina]|uniref:N-acyl amino acid synthase of PEP-CTERM/exosortase system n=1 Tax=Halomonas cerina TaxID=447424 RepID=A0A839VDB0_9GAMM|nr:PEP-CTERM/exosortase system-associated acyltransferase [Halomonas cerina]MBB3191369.1 N-acyl amino acid synthase of PEP-CTERM/exosortase system [Halomonas cerina]